LSDFAGPDLARPGCRIHDDLEPFADVSRRVHARSLAAAQLNRPDAAGRRSDAREEEPELVKGQPGRECIAGRSEGGRVDDGGRRRRRRRDKGGVRKGDSE
jgi:hypothetical protein